MKIAVAQCSAIKGDISLNVENHLKYVRAAGSLGVTYIVFPELSLTGYELELANALCLSQDDKRLEPLVLAAKEYNMSIGVGAPIKSDGLPKIGLIIIDGDGNVQTYEKIFLHEGEDIYFSSGDKYHYITREQDIIANAICADTINSEYAKNCSLAGASIYIAGVLVTPQGYEKDANKWASYASGHNMLVAIANYNQVSGGLQGAGKSAIWYKNGLLSQAGDNEDAIVLAQKIDGIWSAKVHQL